MIDNEEGKYMTRKTVTKIKISLIIILLILSAILISLWASTHKPVTINTGESFRDLPIMRISGSYIIDVDNLNELVGDASYVFVAKVIREDGNEYRDHVTKESENGGTETFGRPFTNYSVNIIENIKGNLITEDTIPLRKSGGLYEDGSGYAIFEDDELPVVGETYIFFANADFDGVPLVSGPNSNPKIDIPAKTKTVNIEKIVKDSKKVTEIKDATKTQVIVLPREKAKSQFEQN
jgi:hypothetical protein